MTPATYGFTRNQETRKLTPAEEFEVRNYAHATEIERQMSREPDEYTTVINGTVLSPRENKLNKLVDLVVAEAESRMNRKFKDIPILAIVGGKSEMIRRDFAPEIPPEDLRQAMGARQNDEVFKYDDESIL